MVKDCTSCGATKPIDEFYRLRVGRMARCKDCWKAAVAGDARMNFPRPWTPDELIGLACRNMHDAIRAGHDVAAGNFARELFRLLVYHRRIA